MVTINAHVFVQRNELRKGQRVVYGHSQLNMAKVTRTEEIRELASRTSKREGEREKERKW